MSILDDWVKENPHLKAQKQDFLILSEKTNLTKIQISRWLTRQRNKKQEKITKISPQTKLILLNHFKNVSRKPSQEEIFNLQKQTGIESKKIINWFTKERFKKK